MPHPTLVELDRQMRELDASPAAAAAMVRWADAEPALAGFATPCAILARRRYHPEEAPALLAALSRLAAAGDDLAARTLFKALLPGLITMASGPLADDPDALDELIPLAWERIRTYPTHRPGSVAANVLWDVRKRYRRHRELESPPRIPKSFQPSPVAPSAEEVALGHSWVDDLHAARRAGVIGASALALILRTRLEGATLAEAAAEQHRNTEWANCVRWRAELRLRPVLDRAS